MVNWVQTHPWLSGLALLPNRVRGRFAPAAPSSTGIALGSICLLPSARLVRIDSGNGDGCYSPVDHEVQVAGCHRLGEAPIAPRQVEKKGSAHLACGKQHTDALRLALGTHVPHAATLPLNRHFHVRDPGQSPMAGGVRLAASPYAPARCTP
jgi:hypothetical protein